MLLDQNSTLRAKLHAFSPRTTRKNGSEEMQLSIDFDEEDEYGKILSSSEAVNEYRSLIARGIRIEDDCLETERPPTDLGRCYISIFLYVYASLINFHISNGSSKFESLCPKVDLFLEEPMQSQKDGEDK